MGAANGQPHKGRCENGHWWFESSQPRHTRFVDPDVSEQNEEENQPPIGNEVPCFFPTGNWCVTHHAYGCQGGRAYKGGPALSPCPWCNGTGLRPSATTQKEESMNDE
jgi:hypothetical protein